MPISQTNRGLHRIEEGAMKFAKYEALIATVICTAAGLTILENRKQETQPQPSQQAAEESVEEKNTDPKKIF